MSRNLQMLIGVKTNQRFEIVSIDDFMKLATDETIYEDDVYEISGDMCRRVQEILQTLDGAIIDHVITSPRILCQLQEMTAGYDLKMIHVTCPLEELLRREQLRGNRCKGTAESSYTYLYPKDGYDLTVDSHCMDSEACAEMIYRTYFE